MANLKWVFEILDEDPYANVFDSKDDTVLAMRTVSWNGNTPNLELRKWKLPKEDGEKDTPCKGFSFLSEDGPNQLVYVLLKNGYGNTQEVYDIISSRDDFGKKEKSSKMYSKDEFAKYLSKK